MKYGLLGLIMIVALSIMVGFGIGSCSSIPSTVVDKSGKIVRVQEAPPAPHKDKVTQALEKNPNAAEVTRPEKSKEVLTSSPLPLPKKEEPEVQVVKSEVVVAAPPVVEAGRVPVITPSDIYWVTRMDVIWYAGLTIGVTGAVLALVTLLALGINKNDGTYKGPQSYRRIFAIGIPMAIIGMLLVVFIPSTKEAATMYIVPKIVNSDFVQDRVPEEMKELYGLFKNYMKDKLKTEVKK